MSITKRFNNISSINFIVIDEFGQLFGSSYNITLEIQTSKNINETELEFLLSKLNNKNFIFNLNSTITSYEVDTYDLTIQTPSITLYNDKSNVVFFNNTILNKDLEIINYIETFVKKEFNLGYVKCILDTNKIPETQSTRFNIGKFNLVYDAHFGCLSWLDAEHDEFYNSNCFDCKLAEERLHSIIPELNNALIITKNGICNFKINENQELKILTIDDFATPENLLKYIVYKYKEVLIRGHVKSVTLTSGLKQQITYNLSY